MSSFPFTLARQNGRTRLLLMGFVASALLGGGSVVSAQIIKRADSPAVEDAAAVEVDATAEIISGDDTAAGTSEVSYGTPVATKYRVGAKVVAKGRRVQNIFIMVAVPLECAEQEAQVLEEDFSPQVQNVEFRLLPPDDGARQMLITIPVLEARQEAHAYVTYDVLTKPIIGPTQTAALKAPAKPEKELKIYLSKSPFIDTGHPKIRDAVKQAYAARKSGDDDTASEGEGALDKAIADADSAANEDGPTGAPRIVAVKPIIADREPSADEAASPSDIADGEQPLTDWQRVEALYDFAIDRIKYQEGVDKSSVQVLKEGVGDCQAIGALFVAMCRTEKIPARLVWVDAHQYAEFYLEDEAGQGHWYPVETAGRREFGEMSVARVILQKGDNFRVPERKRERLRYATDFTLLLASPEHQPRVTYVREQL